MKKIYIEEEPIHTQTAQEGVRETQRNKLTEILGSKILKSVLFIIPTLIIYVLYSKFAPVFFMHQFPAWSPHIAGILSAIFFILSVGMVWYSVSHLWEKYELNKSMWLFVLTLALYHGMGLYHDYESKIKTQPATAQLNVIPQVSYGWKVHGTNLVADLQPGEEVSRSFHLSGGYSTPWLVLPADYYRLGFTNQQTIIVDEGHKKQLSTQKIITVWV
jgi:hypothetical protein